MLLSQTSLKLQKTKNQINFVLKLSKTEKTSLKLQVMYGRMKNCSSREKTETTVHKKHASTVITENKEGAGEQF